MNAPNEPAPAQAQGIPTAVVLAGLLAVGLAVSFFLRSSAAPPTPLDPGAAVRNAVAPAPQERAAAAGDVQPSARRDLQREVLLTYQQVVATVEAAQAEMARWDKEIIPLFTNEDGRFLARDRRYLEAVLPYLTCAPKDDLRPHCSGVDTAETISKRVIEITAEPFAHRDDDNYIPDASILPAMQAELARAEAFRDAYGQPRSNIQGFLKLAHEQGVPRSHYTLEEAITRYRAGENPE